MVLMTNHVLRTEGIWQEGDVFWWPQISSLLFCLGHLTFLPSFCFCYVDMWSTFLSSTAMGSSRNCQKVEDKDKVENKRLVYSTVLPMILFSACSTSTWIWQALVSCPLLQNDIHRFEMTHNWHGKVTSIYVPKDVYILDTTIT